jgi:cation transport regulator ChaB
MVDDVDDGKGPPVAESRGSGYGSRPIPDPTVLTTQALYREVAALRELVQQQIEGLRATSAEKFRTIEERLEGIDKATDLRLRTMDSLPTQMDEKIEHLADLHGEKFSSIQTQFTERDTRSERESRDNKVAVDAAFAAQKEAAAKQEETFSKGIDKSEAATQETINKLAELFKTTTDAISAKVDDLKERLGSTDRDLRGLVTDVDRKASEIQNHQAGAKEDRAGLYAGIVAIAAVLAIVGFLISNGP